MCELHQGRSALSWLCRENAKVFVNFNSKSIKHPNKKTVLCQAIAQNKKATQSQPNLTSNQYRAHQGIRLKPSAVEVVDEGFDVLQPGGVRIVALDALQFTTEEFRQHFEALWRTFLSSYCYTADYWPQGCSQLALRNQTLDLALIALSAQRLAFNDDGDSFRLLSMTAYDKGIKMFRKLLTRCQDSKSIATLAVVGVVYALLEASQRPMEDILNDTWGSSQHLEGALVLMEGSGPEVFSDGGFHLFFKKIREMAVRTSFRSVGSQYLTSANVTN